MSSWILDKIFFPSRNNDPWENVEYQEITIPVGDGNVNARIVHQSDDYPFLLFCHGNAGSLGDCQKMVDFFRSFRLNLLFFDYRGYGASTDMQPTTDSILEDGEAVYGYLRHSYSSPCLRNEVTTMDKISRNPCLRNEGKVKPYYKIFLSGMSLGGAVAAHLASRHYDCTGVFLLNTFSSLEDMACIIFPFLPRLIISTVIGMFVNPLVTKEKNISCPILIMHSEADEVVPYYMAEINHASLSSSLLRKISGSHNGPVFIPGDISALRLFFSI